MMRQTHWNWIAGLMLLAVCGRGSSLAVAQVTRGFDTTARAIATGEERQRQPDLWMFEVSYKPMRMIWVDVTNPRTGQKQREQIWYLAYRAQNRTLATRDDSDDLKPVNELDPLPGPTKFLPDATIVTYDDRTQEIPGQTYLDRVIPEAAAAINRVERRNAKDPTFLDSVQAIQDLPEPVDADDMNGDWIYGVASWSGVDPETDYFKVVLSGFSNGYEIRPGPDGVPITWRKKLVQRFARRGDRFDPSQVEFELDGPPEWVYIPDTNSETSTTSASRVGGRLAKRPGPTLSKR